MKFKFIFALFSIMLLLLLASFVFLPYYIFGISLSFSFWRMNWPLFLIWVILFLAFNYFYFTNRTLFMLLEKEDWPALVRYLEERVIQKGRYSSRLVRLLANSYLVLSDSESVTKLENKAGIVKPALLDGNALVFGAARILGRDFSGAVRFFEARQEKAKTGQKEWLRWYYGFALLLDRQLEKAVEEFSLLAKFSGDGVITALSSYFLSENLSFVLPEKEDEFQEISREGRERVLKTLPKIDSWKREVLRLSTDIHVAIISKYMEETGQWLYGY